MVGLELHLDSNDKRGADCREQTGLRTWSVLHCNKGDTETYKYQGGVEILVVLLHVFGIVLRRLSLVHGVKIKLGVVVLDWLEVHP